MIAAQNNVDHGILIHTGTGATSITDNFSGDTVTVIGTAQANQITFSGSANFTVTGGGGADKLAGGSGHNTYVYGAKTNSTPSGADTISNFHVASDKIDFSAISGLNSNTQPVAINFLTSTPSNIAGHTIDVVTSGGNTVVYANASGSSESISAHHEDMQINLTGVTSPNLSDFILHH